MVIPVSNTRMDNGFIMISGKENGGKFNFVISYHTPEIPGQAAVSQMVEERMGDVGEPHL